MNPPLIDLRYIGYAPIEVWRTCSESNGFGLVALGYNECPKFPVLITDTSLRSVLSETGSPAWILRLRESDVKLFLCRTEEASIQIHPELRSLITGIFQVGDVEGLRKLLCPEYLQYGGLIRNLLYTQWRQLTTDFPDVVPESLDLVSHGKRVSEESISAARQHARMCVVCSATIHATKAKLSGQLLRPSRSAPSRMSNGQSDSAKGHRVRRASNWSSV